jgi:hypothetical protein
MYGAGDTERGRARKCRYGECAGPGLSREIINRDPLSQHGGKTAMPVITALAGRESVTPGMRKHLERNRQVSR